MYAVIYYFKETKGQSVIEKEYHRGEMFRLRKNALHYVLDIVQSDYRKDGYGTEPMVGGINCYKSMKDGNGERVITEVRIKVEKA